MGKPPKRPGSALGSAEKESNSSTGNKLDKNKLETSGLETRVCKKTGRKHYKQAAKRHHKTK
jgi:hypothetical protein